MLPTLSATNGLGGQQQKAREAANSASNPDAASTPGDVSGDRSAKREAGGKGTAKGPEGRAQPFKKLASAKGRLQAGAASTLGTGALTLQEAIIEENDSASSTQRGERGADQR